MKYKGGYFPVAPYDHFGELRDEMVIELEKSGLHVERAHHEVGTAGQAEINYRFDELLKAADDVMKFKYIVKNVAWRNGKTATFMPKPIFGDNGSGMHCHQSIWNEGEPLFYDETGYAGLSDMARYYIGGILKHAPSLLAFTNPTVNSYHRLVPGFEAPISLVYSSAQPLGLRADPDHRLQPEGQAHRVPLPRPVGEPLPRLLGAAAGRPRRHQEQDRAARARSTRTSTSCRRTRWPTSHQVPTSLNAVLDSLEADHEFLTEGDVFTPDLIETWIDYKRTNEILPVQMRPHPHEFELYYDI